MPEKLNKLTGEELGKLFPIEIVEYNENWVNLFEKEKEYLQAILKDLNINKIEHYGSTSVRNLCAKPIIDILIELPDTENIDKQIIDLTTANGYIFMQNMTDHIMVVKGYTEEGYKGQAYHIHFAGKGNQLWDGIIFRDYIRKYKNVAEEYGILKIGLSEIFRYDREAYTEAKSEFIKTITKKAKLEIGNI